MGATEDRLLPLKGAYNVRELGGYPLSGSGEGRQVTWGLLYRSGDLHCLTDKDRSFLEGRNIKTIVDFRDCREKFSAPDGFISTVAQTIDLPIDAGSIISLAELKTREDGEAVMCSLYEDIEEKAIPQYRTFFRVLSDPDNLPLLFHCSAGKDRTGIASALILAALGADTETIFEDYLLSAKYLMGKYDADVDAAPGLEPLMSVRRSYLETAFRMIDARHGGMERFLRDDLKADSALLREIYAAG